MNQEINPVEFGIEPVKAKEMTSGLATTIAEREVLKKSYAAVIELPITLENLSSFKELRLKIVKNRTQGIEAWHKTNKAFYLAGGRFVDAIKNKEVLENEQMESKLMEAEKFFENQEKQRLALLKKEREELLQPFVDNLPGGLEDLDQDVFDSFLETKKKAYIDKLEAERLEAERIENERIAREKEIEAQRLENLRLKEEADKLAKSPVKKQLSVWVESFNIPVVGVDNETSKEIIAKFEAFKKWSLSQVDNL